MQTLARGDTLSPRAQNCSSRGLNNIFSAEGEGESAVVVSSTICADGEGESAAVMGSTIGAEGEGESAVVGSGAEGEGESPAGERESAALRGLNNIFRCRG